MSWAHRCPRAPTAYSLSSLVSCRHGSLSALVTHPDSHASLATGESALVGREVAARVASAGLRCPLREDRGWQSSCALTRGGANE